MDYSCLFDTQTKTLKHITGQDSKKFRIVYSSLSSSYCKLCLTLFLWSLLHRLHEQKFHDKILIELFSFWHCSFICLLVVYLVAGILFNKYSKVANGMELIPNVNFWIDFPSLVKVSGLY